MQDLTGDNNHVPVFMVWIWDDSWITCQDFKNQITCDWFQKLK